MRRIFVTGRHLLTAFFIATVSGCASPVTSREVTRSTKYHVGFVPGRIYELQQDAALYTCSGGGAVSYARAHPQDDLLVVQVPKDCVYLTPLGRSERAHLSTVPKGSRVRVDKLKCSTFVTLSDVHRIVSATGTLLDADDEGSTVILTYVSTLVDVPGLLVYANAQSPDPTMLKELVPPGNR